MTPATYTTDGSVRGTCGHEHRTLAAAYRCLDADALGCAQQGGYSDRTVHAGYCTALIAHGRPCDCIADDLADMRQLS